MLAVRLVPAVHRQRQGAAKQVGGFEHDCEALDDCFRQAHVANIAVAGAFIDEALFLRVLLHGVDLRILAELDALGPGIIEIETLAGRFRALDGGKPDAGFFDVFAIRRGEFRQRIGNFPAVRELENDRLILDAKQARFDFPVLDIGPGADLGAMCEGETQGEKGKDSHGEEGFQVGRLPSIFHESSKGLPG